MGDEPPKNYKGQTTVVAGSCPSLEKGGKERRKLLKKEKKKKEIKGKTDRTSSRKECIYKATAEVSAYKSV